MVDKIKGIVMCCSSWNTWTLISWDLPTCQIFSLDDFDLRNVVSQELLVLECRRAGFLSCVVKDLDRWVFPPCFLVYRPEARNKFLGSAVPVILCWSFAI